MSEAAYLSKDEIYDKFPGLKNRYELIGNEAIGEPSGFGAVWLAKDKWIPSEVALKVSSHDLSAEVKLCRDIDGETVRVFDFYMGIETWQAYTMEHLSKPWVTLSSYISRHKYKAHDIQHYFDSFEIIRSILHGLTTLHGKPYQRTGSLIHADIKPANLFVLINPKKRPHTVFRMPSYIDMIKIIDLGVSVGKGEEIWAYTPAYRPEGITEAGHGYDLYAVAVSFIELLTGQRPTHDQMSDKRRLRKVLATRSSGSVYIDDIALNFVAECKNASTQRAITARKLITRLDETLFNKEPLRLLCLRFLVKELKGETSKAGLAEILFPVIANNWGWQRKSEKRIDLIKDFIDDLLCEGIIIKGSNTRKYRASKPAKQ